MKNPPKIKTPCPMRWDDMVGDSRRRFCDHCQLHVQNLSAMSDRQTGKILARSATERVCVTYVRRADGTMVTRIDSLRERMTAPFRRTFSWLLAAFLPVALGACSTPRGPGQQLAGAIGPRYHSAESGKNASKHEERVVITGGI